jgi:hypothetical protein
MPIFCSGVNRASDEKLVPITRQNGASIVPDNRVITLELVAASPENGPFWELDADNDTRGCTRRPGEPTGEDELAWENVIQ